MTYHHSFLGGLAAAAVPPELVDTFERAATGVLVALISAGATWAIGKIASLFKKKKPAPKPAPPKLTPIDKLK